MVFHTICIIGTYNIYNGIYLYYIIAIDDV